MWSFILFVFWAKRVVIYKDQRCFSSQTTHPLSCFLVACAGVPQREVSMGGGCSHAQSAHRVPLPAHQLQQIQGPMGGHSVIHSRHTHTHEHMWVDIHVRYMCHWCKQAPVSLLCALQRADSANTSRENDNLQLTQIIITGEHLSQMIYLFFYLKISSLYLWRNCCHRIFVSSVKMWYLPWRNPIEQKTILEILF